MQHIVALDDSESPLDMDGFRQWTKNLHAARNRSLQQPTLFEGSEALAPIHVPAISYDGDPHRREPPAFARASGQHRLKLISRLGSASARPQADGQAWLAHVDDTEQKVIAKIFCPSFQIPEKPSVHDFEDVPRPRQRARTEAQAYSSLSCYQGLWIPYFLGIYEVRHLELRSNALLIPNAPHRLNFFTERMPTWYSWNMSPVNRFSTGDALMFSETTKITQKAIQTLLVCTNCI